jgi:hypothetical protein
MTEMKEAEHLIYQINIDFDKFVKELKDDEEAMNSVPLQDRKIEGEIDKTKLLELQDSLDSLQAEIKRLNGKTK